MQEKGNVIRIVLLVIVLIAILLFFAIAIPRFEQAAINAVN